MKVKVKFTKGLSELVIKHRFYRGENCSNNKRNRTKHTKGKQRLRVMNAKTGTKHLLTHGMSKTCQCTNLGCQQGTPFKLNKKNK